ncbi:hypothetical protein [Pseudomonas sp. Irchel s3a18]|uniref:hypothetical protein n=1 Tax=Pseudomonas sp. Irchel s3a18 TaxID=2009053 RepID=UPI000BA43629|nr:hypothetical protein [Pseudomonas sp. Irchel s3a18]
MGNVLDGRPLLVRLQKRIDKYQGCTTKPLVTDIDLHQQSVSAIKVLLDALQDLLEDLDDRAMDVEPNPGQRNCMERARTAIAKATQ